MIFVKLILCVLFVGLCLSLKLSRHDIRVMQWKRSLGIIGGNKTSITKHPYQVALLHGENEFLCSAAVLSKYWVVTLAECVFEKSPNNFKVRAGSDDAESGGNIYEVAKFVVHPKYTNMSIDYDFSLLKMRRPFKFGPKLKTINIPKSKPKAGLQTTISGWGWLSVNISFSHVLLEARTTIIKHKKCGEAYKGLLTNRMICSFNKDAGPCYASDYGSLLVSRNTLLGLFSLTFGCGDKHYPPIYTNIAAVKKWIKKTIKTKMNK